jgi:hypothetical protein
MYHFFNGCTVLLEKLYSKAINKGLKFSCCNSIITTGVQEWVIIHSSKDSELEITNVSASKVNFGSSWNNFFKMCSSSWAAIILAGTNFQINRNNSSSSINRSVKGTNKVVHFPLILRNSETSKTRLLHQSHFSLKPLSLVVSTR